MQWSNVRFLGNYHKQFTAENAKIAEKKIAGKTTKNVSLGVLSDLGG
jgi:hypothetical protein